MARCRITMLLILTASLLGCGSSGASEARGPATGIDGRGESASSSATWNIPIQVNQDVREWLYYFQTRGRRDFEIYLSRAARYEPMIRSILRRHGLPDDLVYLALIESGFDPNAYSRAHAVGLWQFIESTGREAGLRIDGWVDERRDPVEATEAAASHLKQLHAELGSWYLAAAAYNTGRTRVRRAIRRAGSRDFWTLSELRYLSRETRNYVPKLIAAALLAKEPAAYALRVRPTRPLAYEAVEVPDATSLDVIARTARVSLAEVVELNPHLVRRATPPGEAYRVRLPPGSGLRFALNYRSIPPDARLRSIHHVVRPGETLSRLARRYGTSVSSILTVNRGLDPRRLSVGRRLSIPITGATVGSRRPAD